MIDADDDDADDDDADADDADDDDADADDADDDDDDDDLNQSATKTMLVKICDSPVLQRGYGKFQNSAGTKMR